MSTWMIFRIMNSQNMFAPYDIQEPWVCLFLLLAVDSRRCMQSFWP